MHDRTAEYLSALHRILYRVTGGRIGRRLVHNDMCVLTTTGRRTGHPHAVPLLYLRNRDRIVVVASWGGRDHHPQWYLNLVEHPDASVQVLAERWPVIARTATGAERAEWWPKILDAYDGYAEYESRTERVIPVVFLDPTGRPPD